MKRIAQVLALLLILVGVVWFLQGINVLPGSFMTGQRKWTINGAIAIAAGVGLLALTRRKRPSERSELP